jgi:hypothetical protein
MQQFGHWVFPILVEQQFVNGKRVATHLPGRADCQAHDVLLFFGRRRSQLLNPFARLQQFPAEVANAADEVSGGLTA